MTDEHTHGKHGRTESKNAGEWILDNIRRHCLRIKNGRCLRKWSSCAKGDPAGRYYVKRKYETGISYYDLYWYVRRKSDRRHMETIYLRADETCVGGVITETENVTLPQLFVSMKEKEEK